MRCFPPCVAEVYINVMLAALEARGTASAAGETNRRTAVAQPVRIIVPAFDHNYVMWPSYVQKLFVHYNEQLLARQVSTERVMPVFLAQTFFCKRSVLSVSADLIAWVTALVHPSLNLVHVCRHNCERKHKQPVAALLRSWLAVMTPTRTKTCRMTISL